MTTVKKVVAVLVYTSGYDKLGFVRRFKGGLFMYPYVLDVLADLTEQGLRKMLNGSGIEFKTYSFNLQLEQDACAFFALEKSLRNSDESTKVILATVGVMAYQLPFAVNTMLRWKNLGAHCFIGGPIVNGGLAEMLEGVPEGSPHSGQITGELKLVQDCGFSIFAGDAYPYNSEIESFWDTALRDTIFGTPQPIYKAGWTSLSIAPIPPWKKHPGYLLPIISVDQQSGCPYFEQGKGCSFCGIGSLSGKKARVRKIPQVIQYLRETFASGCPKNIQIFLLGDNGARSENSIEFLKKLSELRKEIGIPFLSSLQVDTQSYKIPGFVDLMENAGVAWVFVGVETPDHEGLKTIGKKQNHPEEYKDFCDAMWKKGINPLGSTMIGQKHHTPAIIIKEVEELCEAGFTPLFTIYTFSPGSPEHSAIRYAEQTISLDEFNSADSSCRVADHTKMSRAELQEAYWEAWKKAYEFKYQINRLRRLNSWNRWLVNFGMSIGFWRAGQERVHPLLTGSAKIFDDWDKKPESLPLSGWKKFKLKNKTRFSEIFLNLKTLAYAALLAAATAPFLRSFKKNKAR